MKDMIVYNLVVDIKVYQGDLYNMYLEQTSNFTMDIFWVCKFLFECKHENILMKWILDLNYRVQLLAFEANGQHIWEVHHDLETMMLTFVTTSYFLLFNHW